VDHVVYEVERQGLANVTFVAHSWGGYPMGGAVHRLLGKVTEVIYYSAHVPVTGRSMIDDIPEEAAAIMRGLIDASPTRAIVPTPQFVQRMFLMQGVEESTQRLVADLLTPQPGDYFLDALDAPSVSELGIPARYILGEDDQALPRSGAEFAARIGLEPIMVPGTHEGMLTHPDEIANAILNRGVPAVRVGVTARP
jgi:pimeloyl-ACP methyl ester carboxylesterase